MSPKFPQRREDGTFDLVINIRGQDLDESEIAVWISRWAEKNQQWLRRWEMGAGEFEDEHLLLAADFVHAPSCSRTSENTIELLWPVRAQSKRWKDWMAQLVSEFCAAHPTATFEGVKSRV